MTSSSGYKAIFYDLVALCFTMVRVGVSVQALQKKLTNSLFVEEGASYLTVQTSLWEQQLIIYIHKVILKMIYPLNMLEVISVLNF